MSEVVARAVVVVAAVVVGGRVAGAAVVVALVVALVVLVAVVVIGTHARLGCADSRRVSRRASVDIGRWTMAQCGRRRPWVSTVQFVREAGDTAWTPCPAAA